MNKRGMSPIIRNFLIIVSLLVAISFIIIILYNLVSEESEILGIETIGLSIIKESVQINGQEISMTLRRGEENADLKIDKIMAVIYDGAKQEIVYLDSSYFEAEEERQFQFTLENLTDVKSISIKSIINKNGKEWELDVEDTYRTKSSLSGINLDNCGDGTLDINEECDDNNLFREDGCSETCEIETCIEQNGYVCLGDKTCTGKLLVSPDDDEICCEDPCVIEILGECSECGQGFGFCDETKCYSIEEDCYYGSDECISCSSMSCDEYEDEDDCGEDRCNLECYWDENEESCLSVIPVITLKSNGETCTGNTECSSGYCYVDNDGDRYYPSSGTKTCRATSSLGTDCNDNNAAIWTGPSCITPLQPNGVVCSLNSQCTSGYCIDGICCNNQCSSTCQACNLAGLAGTCSNIAAGTDPSSECNNIQCTNYIYGWNGKDCVKYLTNTANNGMCNGAGSCYSTSQSCTGIGAISVSCGSLECKNSCRSGELGTSYDSIGEVCYTSGGPSCLAKGYSWVNTGIIYNAWVDTSYGPEYGPDCNNDGAVGWAGYFIETTRPEPAHIWSAYFSQEGAGPIWSFRCDFVGSYVCDTSGTCVAS